MTHHTDPAQTDPTAPVAVACVDALGRTGRVTLVRDGAQVVLRTPPGEAARLSPADAAQLGEILHRLAQRPAPADAARTVEGGNQ